MKKINKAMFFFMIFCIFISNAKYTYANPLDYGIYGGISEGRKLPKTTEQLLNNKKNDTLESTYKEMIFLEGAPKEFEGLIVVKDKGVADDDKGTYKMSFQVKNSDTTKEETQINRNISYNVNYRKEKNQTIKDYEMASWKETITLGDARYEIDPKQSKSSISIIEDKTPAVTYYKGDVSHRAVYMLDEEKITLNIQGVIYGYSSAWSSTETQRLDCTVSTPEWQMEYQIRPSVSVSKMLDYSKNEPTAISFEGNYKEITQNKSGLNYNIYVLPTNLAYTQNTTGNISIPSFNTFEQLVAPDLSYLKGHFAQEDIKKMFAMGIIDSNPSFYKPNQAITRGQFTKMLVNAIKLPIDNKKDKDVALDIVFSDVLPDREEYPYIMKAYETGLVFGGEAGKFYIDDPIERQEAVVILLRTLGLSRLGLSPTPITTFVDDEYIAKWAKKEIYAANKIGIVKGDIDGKFNPKTFINKAEAAAFINRLIDYMRKDMQIDYTENIVNYAN